MSGLSGPSFKCHRLPRICRRFKKKSSKYHKTIINNFFFGNQYIVNNTNVTQFNNCQFKSGSFEEKNQSNQGVTWKNVNEKQGSQNYFDDFGNDSTDEDISSDLKKTLAPLKKSVLALKENPNSFFDFPSDSEIISLPLPQPGKVTLNKVHDYESIHPVNFCLPQGEDLYVTETVKTGMLISSEKHNSLNYQLLKTPPDVLCTLAKRLQVDLKGKFKKIHNKSKKATGLYLKYSTKKDTPQRKLSPVSENNTLSSSGTSTPLHESNHNKRNWELSPIKLYYREEGRNSYMSSTEDIKESEYNDTSVSAFDVVKNFSNLMLEENDSQCIERENKEICNQKENNNYNSIENTYYENSRKSMISLSQENMNHTYILSKNDKFDNSEDIFGSLNSFSIDKTASLVGKTELEKLRKSIQSLNLFSSPQEKQDTSSNLILNHKEDAGENYSLQDYDKCNKTCISINLDSCDFYSARSSSRFNIDVSENSLNLSFDITCVKNNFVANNALCLEPKNYDILEHFKKITPGKKWRRSLFTASKRSRMFLDGKKEKRTICPVTKWNIRYSLNPQNYNSHNFTKQRSPRYTSFVRLNKLQEMKEKFTPEFEATQQSNDKASNDNSFTLVEHHSGHKISDIGREKYETKEEPEGELDFTFVIHQQVANLLQNDDLNKTLLSVSPDSKDHQKYAEINVLNLCGITSPIDFKKAYPEYFLRNCKKIGEGEYGEVFCYFPHCSEKSVVLKIIPIEGDRLVNFSPQKTYSEVFSEMCIAFSLSGLKNFFNNNYTDGFCSLLRMTCLKGEYPEKLIALWDEYDKSKISQNDSPKMFDSEQLYIALEMVHGGEALENYQFSSARQSYSILLQVIHSLAVAEKAFEFEHRDLHWGNILISKTNETKIKYIIDGIVYCVTSYGKKATIIDYTLSRIRTGNFDIYNDISNENELFEAYGDPQFEVYRKMKDDVNNNWQLYVPKTNVRWIHYLSSKCYHGVYYKADHNIHKKYLKKLKCLRDVVLNYESSADIVKNLKA